MRNRVLKELRILLVEDEEKLASLLKNAIGDSFYSFHISSNGKEGLEMFKTIAPDIVITDIMMPYMDGLEMSKEIRHLNIDVPIIILSAFSETDKFLNAIDVGVVKYLIKPFDPDELLDYISSLSERFESKLIKLVDDYTFNTTKKTLYKNSRYVALSKNEKIFLGFLIENFSQNEMIKDEEIKSLLWGDEEVSNERLRTFIRRFRQKTSKELVLNLKGFGYQINKLVT
jgi:DNA-binding response OmpR family regulator